MLKGFPCIISVSSFRQLEKWASETTAQWNRLSPYDETLRVHFHDDSSCSTTSSARKMANLDRNNWGDFKAYLDKSEQWLTKNDIPVYQRRAPPLLSLQVANSRLSLRQKDRLARPPPQSVLLLQTLLTPMTKTNANAL